MTVQRTAAVSVIKNMSKGGRIMNKGKIIATLLTVALMLGGCAKKELVKSEEPAVPAVTSSATDSKSSVPAETSVSTPAVPDATTTTSTDLDAAGASALADQQKGLLETVYFDYDSFVLSESTRDALSRNAQALKRKYAGMVRLEGHCDERGSDEYNLALGEKRAQSARSYLVTLGVAPERLSVISYGKERPAVQGSSDDAWAKNRRVEFVLTK
jgi:peptidoglycan-associated lipoprotein